MTYKFIKLNIILISLVFLAPSFSYGFNYCSENNKKISVNFIIPKNYPDSEKKSHLKAFNQIISTMAPGDYLQFSITKQNNTINILNQCFPGCPPKSMSEQIFGIGEKCNTTRMKRDKNIFDMSLAKPFISLKKQGDIIEDGVTDLFQTLESLSKFQKVKEFDKSYIVNSMNPLNTTNITDDKIDALFVKLVEEDRMPKNLPDVIFSGVLQNSKILTFWDEVFSVNKKKFLYE